MSNSAQSGPGVAGPDAYISPYQRRRQIMRSALTLAMTGGLETMQMREVAAAAQVSTRTVYNHFPSQEYLLLAATTDAAEQTWEQAGRDVSRRATPSRRVKALLNNVTATLASQPELARAIVRALTCGQPAIAPLVSDFDANMRTVIANVLATGPATEADFGHAKLIQQVWFAAMVSWASGVDEVEDIGRSVDVALRLIRS